MLMGLRFQARPTAHQKLVLSQWLGCARVIWNAKCQEYRYHRRFSQRLGLTGTRPPIDQKYAQFKDTELTPWLYRCPSQILRNSAVNWFKTFQNHFKGLCGKPRFKKKHDHISLHLTRELFSFEKDPKSGALRLLIGTKKNHIGVLDLNYHTKRFALPKSIRIKKRAGRYWVSFCYEDGLDTTEHLTQSQHLERLRALDVEQLETMVEAVDVGVVTLAETTCKSHGFTPEQKRSVARHGEKKKALQKAMSRGQKGSKRREKKKRRMARASEKIANIRRDAHHKISAQLVEDADVLIFEDLRVSQMTRRPQAKRDEAGGALERRGVRAKARLNRAILNAGWHQLYQFTKYKAFRASKVTFKVRAHYSSQECADCHHTHPRNRVSQASFVCQLCGHHDNADRNAARVLKQRAIKRILDSGTELSARGVLLPDKGRREADQSRVT